MKTIQDNIKLSQEERLKLLKDAKGSPWYDGWKPYCCVPNCTSRLNRMVETEYGFRCSYCGNMIGWDLGRLQESPLNKL